MIKFTNLSRLTLYGGLVVTLTACAMRPVSAPAPAATPAPAPTAASAGTMAMRTTYPLTIVDCAGHSTIYKEAPKTPVTLDPQAYELMFWLGLGQLQIAAGPQPLPAVPDQFKEQTKMVKTLPKDENAAYVSKEVLLSAGPDFVYGSYPSGFNGEAMFSEADWASKGVNAYFSFGIGGCKDDDPKAPRTNLDATFRDIENLGKIFDVQERAQALTMQMKEDLAKALASVGNGPKPRVSLFAIGDYVEGKPGVYGTASAVNAVITMAGGENAFGDLAEAYVETNWEEYVKRNPDVILIVAYPAAAPQAWIDAEKLLSKMPAVQEIPAVKKKRFVRVTFPEVGAGGVRNVDAVKKLAAAFATYAAEPAAPANAGATKHTTYPLTIENCGRKITFTKAPERIVTTWHYVTEYLVKLGLTDKIVGSQNSTHFDSPADIAADFKRVPVLSPTSASKEVLLAAKPDVIVSAFFSWDFSGKDGMPSMEDLQQASIQVFGYSDNCTADSHVSSKEMFADFLTIGRIFDVEDRAQAIVDEMQAQIADVQKKVAGLPKTKAYFDAGGEGPVGTAGAGLQTEQMEIAGGTNVFADKPNYYMEVSTEEVVARQPEIFLVDTWGRNGKEDYLQTRTEWLFKTFSTTPAAQNKRYVQLLSEDISPGIRYAEGILKMAQAFHPEAFKK